MDATPPLPPMKLSRSGRPTHKRVGGPVVLNSRMLRMIDLMVKGHPDDPSRTPYGLYDAAAAVGYQRRAARALAGTPIFVEAYWRVYRGESSASAVPTPIECSCRPEVCDGLPFSLFCLRFPFLEGTQRRYSYFRPILNRESGAGLRRGVQCSGDSRSGS